MKKDLLKFFYMMSNYALKIAFVNLLSLQFLFASSVDGQQLDKVKVSLDLTDANIVEVLDAIESKTDFEFAYSRQVESLDKSFTLKYDKEILKKILEDVSAEGHVTFNQINCTITVSLSLKKDVSAEASKKVERTITGRITDDEGEPLPGAAVQVKSQPTIGAVADVDGNYSIDVPDDATTLVYSYIGFAPQEIDITNRTIVDVTLIPDISTLDEMIVSTGYWETEKRLNPGNIARVGSKEIQQQPVSNPLQALQGRMAGVQIEQSTGVPGGLINIQIRGTNSLRADGNQPLIVIDGVPFPADPLTQGSFGAANLASSPLNSINPSDIESIEVLKDADATAIYGSRGANGVVLIKTKRGVSDKTNIAVDFWRGFGQVGTKMDLLNTEQYLQMRNEAFQNDGIDPASRPDFQTFDLFEWDSTRYTDWQEELIGSTADITNINLNITGGSANTNFLIGGGYYKETTVYPGDFGLERGSLRMNLNHYSADGRFSISGSLNFATDKNDLVQEDLTRDALTLAPNAPALIDGNGNVNRENDSFDENPLIALQQRYTSSTNNLVTNFIVTYNLLEDLDLKMTGGYNLIQNEEVATVPISSWNPNLGIDFSQVNLANNQTETWIAEPQITYDKTINDLNLKFLIGSTFQKTVSEGESLSAFGASNDALIENLESHTSIRAIGTNFTEFNYSGVFGRINLQWKEKYVLNLTGRRDGSSRFGPGNRFGNFGAVGAAWIFSEEQFLSNIPFISFGKLKISYGTTGSDRITDYQFLRTYRSGAPYQGAGTLIPSRLPNNNFSWEANRKLETGISLGILENRFLLDVNWFRNRSSNQLVGLDLPAISGFTSIQSNFPATVENRGWEFELSTSIIQKGDFKWTANFNLSIPRNELIEFDDIEGTNFDNRVVVGEPVAIVGALHFSGVDPETGLNTFEDLNDNGSGLDVPEDLQFRNANIQDFFGGLGNTISYKGLELSFLFQFVKQDAPNYQAFFNSPGTFSNQPIEVLDRWQNPGDITNVQRYSTEAGTASTLYRPVGGNDMQFDDASFIRLKNVSLIYNFSKSLVERFKLEQARVFIQGQNLLTITDYIGLDPESRGFNLPPLRVISVGASVTL